MDLGTMIATGLFFDGRRGHYLLFTTLDMSPLPPPPQPESRLKSKIPRPSMYRPALAEIDQMPSRKKNKGKERKANAWWRRWSGPGLESEAHCNQDVSLYPRRVTQFPGS